MNKAPPILRNTRCYLSNIEYILLCNNKMSGAWLEWRRDEIFFLRSEKINRMQRGHFAGHDVQRRGHGMDSAVHCDTQFRRYVGNPVGYRKIGKNGRI